jgi:phage shock protein A
VGDLAHFDGGHESLADVLASENALLEQTVAQLREELDAKRREVSHLRVELGEEEAAA